MKTELNDKGNLSSELTIVLEPDDYKKAFEEQIKSYKKKAHLKGFRKGKTPMTAIRKMYGKTVLAEVVYDTLNKSLEEYIVKKELDILGNPLPSEDQEVIDFDLRNMGSFEFKFDIGMAPDFEVKGVDVTDEYESIAIHITDTDLDEEIEALRKRMGEQKEVEGEVEEMDIIALDCIEIGSENETPFQTEINVMPDRMTESSKKTFLGQSIGFSTEIDLYDLEKNTTGDYINKYFLKDAPENVASKFTATIVKIKRLIPAELDESFYEKAFGPGKVANEEEAREMLQKDLTPFYESQALSLTKRKILEHLIEINVVEMPDEFLKRWLLASNEELSADQVEDEYGDFSKNLRWTLIKKKLSGEYGIEIAPEEIRAAMKEKIKAQFAQYGYGMMGGNEYDGIVERMMQNQQSVQEEYEEILADKVLDGIMERVKMTEKTLNTEEYKEILEELRQNKG